MFLSSFFCFDNFKVCEHVCLSCVQMPKYKTCVFPVPPLTEYYWEPKCKGNVSRVDKGCKADGQTLFEIPKDFVILSCRIVRYVQKEMRQRRLMAFEFTRFGFDPNLETSALWFKASPMQILWLWGLCGHSLPSEDLHLLGGASDSLLLGLHLWNWQERTRTKCILKKIN